MPSLKVSRNMNERLEKLTEFVASALGTSWAFLIACSVFGFWLCTGGSDMFQKNTGAFIVAASNLFMFVHLFIVQRTGNKDIRALHLKLDELIATTEGANNLLIKAEKSSEADLNELRKAYSDLADKPQSKANSTESINVNLPKKRSA